MRVSENIKHYRHLAGLTQKELAEKCGLSIGTIQGYEQGKYTPKIESAAKISSILGCDITDIMPLKNSEKITRWGVKKDTTDAFDGVLVLLIDLFETVNTITDEETGEYCYLLGDGPNRIVLHKEDIEKLYASIKGFASPMISEIALLKKEIERLKKENRKDTE